MKPEDLKKSVTKLTIPLPAKERVLAACGGPSKTSYRFKPAKVAIACLLTIALLLGVPYLYRNPGGETQLVMGISPLVIKAAAESGEQLILEDFAVWTEIDLGRYVPVMNYVPGFPFHFSAPGAKIELFADGGEFVHWDCGIEIETDRSLSFTGSGSGTLVWSGHNYSCHDEGWVFWQPLTEGGLVESAIIEYKTVVAEQITGYGIIQIDAQGNGKYSAQLLLSTGFPQVEGQHQKVTAKDLEKLRAKVLP